MSGDEFIKLRRKLGLNQRELSKLIDVSTRGIRRWETGETAMPKIAELALLYLLEKHQRKKKR